MKQPSCYDIQSSCCEVECVGAAAMLSSKFAFIEILLTVVTFSFNIHFIWKIAQN